MSDVNTTTADPAATPDLIITWTRRQVHGRKGEGTSMRTETDFTWQVRAADIADDLDVTAEELRATPPNVLNRLFAEMTTHGNSGYDLNMLADAERRKAAREGDTRRTAAHPDDEFGLDRVKVRTHWADRLAPTE